jgi:hypothetical protein
MMTMLAGAAATAPEISELQWNRILQRIEGRNVIPVIGENLTLMGRTGSPDPVSLAAHLAAQLGLPGEPPASLNELAFRYMKENPKSVEDLYADIFQALPTNAPLAVPAPLRQLAEIRDFDLFVTTSFDPYMAMALNEVRFGRRSSKSTRVLSYDSGSMSGADPLEARAPQRCAQRPEDLGWWVPFEGSIAVGW